MDIVAQWLLSPDSRPGWGYISYWWASDWVRSFRARSSLLKWAGAAYLIWLGIQQWRAAGAIDLHTLAQTQSRGRLFKRAIFVNLTNPKSIVFLAALFPQFIMPQQPQLAQYLILGVTTIVVDMVVMTGYATLAQRIAAWIKGPKQMKALNKAFGSLFMLVGALLASARHA